MARKALETHNREWAQSQTHLEQVIWSFCRAYLYLFLQRKATLDTSTTILASSCSWFCSQSFYLSTLNYSLKRLNKRFLRLTLHSLKLCPKNQVESGAVIHPAPSHQMHESSPHLVHCLCICYPPIGHLLTIPVIRSIPGLVLCNSQMLCCSAHFIHFPSPHIGLSSPHITIAKRISA